MRIRVRGHSMEPALADGDEVEVEVTERPPRVGEVVLALTDGTTILHRVIAVDSTHVRTQGDARPGPDPAFSRERVLGIAEVARHPLRSHARGAFAWLRERFPVHRLALRS